MLNSERYTDKKIQVFKVCLNEYLPNFKLDKITDDNKIVGQLRYDNLGNVLNKYKSDHFLSYNKDDDTVTFDFITLKSNEMANRLNYISKTIWF